MSDLQPVDVQLQNTAKWEITPVALNIHQELTYEEWFELGRQIATAQAAFQWWIGDWAAAENRVINGVRSEAYDFLEQETGLERNYLAMCKTVAQRIPLINRFIRLSWSHHYLVAALSDDQQRFWLQMALKNKWSVSQLKKAIRGGHDIVDEIVTVTRRVNYGDVWQLDRHRIYCMDSALPAFVEQLPNVSFVFADPPYNADSAEWDNSFNWRHDWIADKGEIVAVTPGISAVADFFSITRMPYRWSMSCWITNGMTRGALGFGNWIYTALFSHKQSIHRNTQDFFQVSVRPSETSETDFKGRKPIGYMTHLLSIFCLQGDYVVDPFLGSGSTLIVAEKRGLRCVGAEIVPEHCDGVIARWEALTGQEARRVDTV